MIGRLYNKARKERERAEERERRRPQEEAAQSKQQAYLKWLALIASDEPWQKTRRIRCACGNTVRYEIPYFPMTFKCTKCGGRQTLFR